MYSTLASLALAISAVSATYQGFNYDATDKTYDDFKQEFTTAANLVGTDGGFTSARLYTMIQSGTTNTPIEALQAAVDTKTTLLLGLWASAGDADFDNELAALKSAISQFPDLSSLIAGISVGSEDLYRETPTGIASDAGVGASPDTIVSYVKQTRAVLSGTSWSSVLVGHVDTWNAWTNSTSDSVISAVDFLGIDEYPYYQTTTQNSIGNAKSVFESAYEATVAVANGKPIWITETGWPTTGSDEGEAVASIANAKTFWDNVGCPLFGSTNVWWYTLADAGASPSFGVVSSVDTTTPIYDLSCANVTSSSSSSSSSATATSSSTASASSAKSTGSGSGSSGSGSGSSSSSSPTYANSTSTASSSGSASTGSSSNSSGSSSSSSGSSSGSSSSGSTSGSSTTSASSSSYTGGASNIGSSVVGIFGAVAAAVLLL